MGLSHFTAPWFKIQKPMWPYSSLQYNMYNITISQTHVKISSNNTKGIKAKQKMGSASPINHSWQQAGLWQRDGWQQWNGTKRNATYIQLVTPSIHCHASSFHNFMREDGSGQSSTASTWLWYTGKWILVVLSSCHIICLSQLPQFHQLPLTTLDWIIK